MDKTNTYLDEIRRYQGDMDAQLRAEDGWLTLSGLYWLQEGPNRIGAAAHNRIVLPEDGVPANLGELLFAPPEVTLQLPEGVRVTVDGDEKNGCISLESDIHRNPTIVRVGFVTFFIIQRGQRTGVRVKHIHHPNRLNFSGRIWWPVDPTFRVSAKIVPYSPAKIITIPDILGDTTEAEIPAGLQFELMGQPYTLDALPMPSGQYYIIFHDLSCGSGSYPPGRFLISEPPTGEQVILDFNKAYNPPCAFTDYATCPFPPKGNYLPLTIQAGERYQPRDHHP